MSQHHRLKSHPSSWLVRLLLLLTSLMSCHPVLAQIQDHPKQHTGPFVAVRDGSIIWDVSTGLVWMRCNVGHVWNGATCAREVNRFDLYRLQEARDEANRFNAGGGWLGYTDWKVPAISELETLVQCRDETKRLFRGDGFICYQYDSPTIDAVYFPGIIKDGKSIHYRTSSSHLINFADGYTLNAYGADQQPYFLRLVRTLEINKSSEISEIIPDWSRYETEVASGSRLVQWVSRIVKVQAKKSDISNDMILKLVTAKYAALDSQELAASLASVPLPSNPARTTPNVAPKGEFEPTAQYESRKATTLKNAEDEFAQATQRYQAALAQRSQLETQAKARLADPGVKQALIAKAWQQALPDYLGSPVLTNLRYDADRQVFSAVLTSSQTTWQQDVSVPVPLNKAQELKVDLQSGKIAPIVTFTVPEMKAEWTLGVNAALRASRFDNARNSIPDLEAFIGEYPESPEATMARSRIYDLSWNSIAALERFVGNHPNSLDAPAARRRALDLAQTSQELVKLTNQYGSWPEAGVAKNRIPAVQKAEFEQARQADSSSAWQSFIEKLAGPDTQKLIPEAQKRLGIARSREASEQRERDAQLERDRPRREAQQLCEAQKATCIASCPMDRIFTTQPDSACWSRCRAVSCY